MPTTLESDEHCLKLLMRWSGVRLAIARLSDVIVKFIPRSLIGGLGLVVKQSSGTAAYAFDANRTKTPKNFLLNIQFK